MQQLYRLDEITDNGNEFVMVAPLRVIGHYLNLHKSAEERIEREAFSTAGCELHDNRGGNVHVVTDHSLKAGTEIRSSAMGRIR